MSANEVEDIGATTYRNVTPRCATVQNPGLVSPDWCVPAGMQGFLFRRVCPESETTWQKLSLFPLFGNHLEIEILDGMQTHLPNKTMRFSLRPTILEFEEGGREGEIERLASDENDFFPRMAKKMGGYCTKAKSAHSKRKYKKKKGRFASDTTDQE